VAGTIERDTALTHKDLDVYFLYLQI